MGGDETLVRERKGKGDAPIGIPIVEKRSHAREQNPP